MTFDIEFERHFLRLKPGQQEFFMRLKNAMGRAFPEALINEDAQIMASLALPDTDDRHVLAAAIQTSAGVIVTRNLKDFPAEVLAVHNVEAKSDDDFISDCIDMSPIQAARALRTMRERFKRPEVDPGAMLLRMEQIGLPQAAAMLAPYQELL
ncbi:PIN domain-containing protein [Paracoccus laeviglucosivorans]|uniref:PIN domain-containing protein n=1 Tax=Paracoccus laeviglucosivorans TaxID=1197861 RepID=A0A521FUF6_9RHOB|nr:PIN domain-containing protein [Paracoccus laeviglucosivorans]